MKTVAILAEGVEFVEAAFGSLSYSISLPEGRLPVEVHEDDLPYEVVVIPAAYCQG